GDGQHRDRTRRRHPARARAGVQGSPRRLPAPVLPGGLPCPRRAAGGPGLRHVRARRPAGGAPGAPGRHRHAVLRSGIPRNPAPGPRPDGPPRRAARARLSPRTRPMNASITARELFEQQHERLGLRWVAGQEGASRVLESVETVARRPSLAGYLNIIYPNKVQILGTEELAWLDGLDSRL